MSIKNLRKYLCVCVCVSFIHTHTVLMFMSFTITRGTSVTMFCFFFDSCGRISSMPFMRPWCSMLLAVSWASGKSFLVTPLGWVWNKRQHLGQTLQLTYTQHKHRKASCKNNKKTKGNVLERGFNPWTGMGEGHCVFELSTSFHKVLTYKSIQYTL